MKILYGVQATGNGHISRSREVINCLKESGHDVQVILSGRDPALLWDMDDFEPYETFRGLTFSTSNGKINILKTVFGLNIFRFYNDIYSYKASGIDLVITDFEPISSRIAVHNRIPCIGIGHQYAFHYDIPVTGANPLSKFIIKNYAPVDYPIGLHWHHFENNILPPIVPHISPPEKDAIPDKILVYLPFEELENIRSLLDPFHTHNFYIYCPIDRSRDENQFHWRPYSRTGFMNDLAECSGVICNAGFELASEALSWGKKILVKPLAGQMEQLSNALSFSILMLGTVMEELSEKSVEEFLDSPPAIPILYPDVAQMLADWIAAGQWDNLKQLVDETWDQVEKDDLLCHRSCP